MSEARTDIPILSIAEARLHELESAVEALITVVDESGQDEVA